MSTAFTPFGFVPVYHPSGLDRPTEITPGVVGSRSTSANVTFAIAKFDPINVSNGAFPFSSTIAGAGNVDGVFLGCEFTNQLTGRREVTPYLAANTTIIDPVYWIANDPNIVYEVLTANSGASPGSQVSNTVIGSRYDAALGTPSAIVVGAGTGLSGSYLQVGGASVATGAFQIIDHGWDAVAQGAWYDADSNTFPIVRVKLVGSGFPLA